MTLVLILILIGFIISVPALILNKLEGSMKGFFLKGFGGLGPSDEPYIECPSCHCRKKRGHSAPYCEKCRKFF